MIQLLYLPFVIFGVREVSRANRLQRNFLLIVTAIILYFWAMTTLVSLPLLRYLVPAISLVMIVAAVGFDVSAMSSFQRLFSAGQRAGIAQER